jgi:hypothetical protein
MLIKCIGKFFIILKKCSYQIFKFVKNVLIIFWDFLFKFKLYFKNVTKKNAVVYNNVEDLNLNAILEKLVNDLQNHSNKRGKNKTYEKIESFNSLAGSFVRMQLPIGEFLYSYR